MFTLYKERRLHESEPDELENWARGTGQSLPADSKGFLIIVVLGRIYFFFYLQELEHAEKQEKKTHVHVSPQQTPIQMLPHSI